MILAAFQGSNVLLAVGPIVVIFLLLYWLTRPLNKLVRAGELGFYLGKEKNKLAKERPVESSKRLRVIGDLPPVYPNGWFCIGESYDLNNGELKPIVFMGRPSNQSATMPKI